MRHVDQMLDAACEAPDDLAVRMALADVLKADERPELAQAIEDRRCGPELLRLVRDRAAFFKLPLTIELLWYCFHLHPRVTDYTNRLLRSYPGYTTGSLTFPPAETFPVPTVEPPSRWQRITRTSPAVTWKEYTPPTNPYLLMSSTTTNPVSATWGDAAHNAAVQAMNAALATPPELAPVPREVQDAPEIAPMPREVNDAPVVDSCDYSSSRSDTSSSYDSGSSSSYSSYDSGSSSSSDCGSSSCDSGSSSCD